jgi:hypothetical protein
MNPGHSSANEQKGVQVYLVSAPRGCCPSPRPERLLVSRAAFDAHPIPCETPGKFCAPEVFLIHQIRVIVTRKMNPTKENDRRALPVSVPIVLGAS